MQQDNEVNITDPCAEEFLRLCSRQYDLFIEKLAYLKKKGSAEAVLAWIEMMAGFAAMHHPGRFSDGIIENTALDIGAKLPPPKQRCLPAFSRNTGDRRTTPKRRVLHVTTLITSYGGHARIILNWIKKDQDSQHSLVLTRQQSTPLFPALTDAVALSGGNFVSLPASASIIERARWLRLFALETADLVILHLVPNDIVPVVAFANCGGVPVAQLNLSDQLFWVGSSVADMIINLRELSISTSKDLRHTRNDQLLPIPICESHATLNRADARNILGIPESQTMLLSVGRSVKYTPSKSHNFFRTVSIILDRNPDAHLYIVGVKEEDHSKSPIFKNHSRLHFTGPVEDVSVWQKASDVYLEGFPFGSQTALLESILPGVPCVRVFAPLSPLLAAEDVSLTGIVDTPRDEEEYILRASEFIIDLNKRIFIGNVLKERVLYHHVNQSWNRQLENIYQKLERLEHTSSRIPHTESFARTVDLAISEYHSTRFLGNKMDEALERVATETIMGTAYSLRQSGFHSDAFHIVRISRHRKHWDNDTIIFAAKILLHRLFFNNSKAY
ncbi:MAG: hypothetical protein VR65_02450 [Desulfobulbaceae bacterium BRH_c16a]|nr:MAG: hypothetical protein VR65_02450 [Desulfobulbaceae bacterium BRH_c16a]